MPKAKTHKAVSKRFMVKTNGNKVTVWKRVNGQDHFNATESGKVGRNKKNDREMSITMKNTVLKSMPNAL